MRSAFFKIVVFLLLISCSNVNFLLTQKNSFDFLQNKTAVYVDGWEKTVLKENLFSMLGDVSNQRFVLTAKVSEEKKNRSVSENQVAQKIDYKITISYTLVDVTEKCPDLKSTQTSRFSFTPKSAGYNFASDVMLKKLFEEAVSSNINNFISFVDNELPIYNCLDEN